VLLPIVYNALAQSSEQHATPFFKALHKAMKCSSYYPLLSMPSNDFLAELAREEEAAG
jgi:hypothetical protein